MSLGENIKNFRKQKGLTQKELAEAVGLTASTITKYEKGMLEPSIGILSEIADTLDIKTYSLISPLDLNDSDSTKIFLNQNLSWLMEILKEDVEYLDEKEYAQTLLTGILSSLEYIYHIDKKYGVEDKRETIELYEDISKFITFLCYTKGLNPITQEKILPPSCEPNN